MAEPPKEDRDRRTEDLFEDLDQFFAPLEEDWPEGDEPDQPPGREVTPAPSEAEPVSAEPAAPERAAAEPGAPEPAGVGGDPGAREPRIPAEADDEDDALGGLDELAREEDWIAEATSEMRPQEWDLEEPAPADPASVGEPPGGQATAGPPRVENEPTEGEPTAPPAGERLTPADLRTPPPAYADLPGPRDEARPDVTEGTQDDEILVDDEPTMDDLEMPLAFDDEMLGEGPPGGGIEDEPEEDRIVHVTSEIPTGGLPAPPPPEVEPDEEDVAAAAEHFAAGLRPDDVERDLLSDLEGSSRTAPIDREAVMEHAAASESEEPGAEAAVGSTAAIDDTETPPSWDDGAARTATETGEQEPPSGPRGMERNLVAAFVSGVVLLALAIGLLAIGTGAFAFLAAAVILLAQGELYAVMRKQGYEPATLLGLAMGALIVAGGFLKTEGAVLFALSLSMLLVVLWYMAAPPAARRGTLRDAGVTMLGVVYVPFLASFAMLLLAAESPEIPDVGRNLFLVVIGLTVLYDICAYAIGSLWGSRPLASTISPRKSWEGAIGATFVLLLVALAIVPQVEPFSPGNAVGLALVIALAAPLGDLVESAIKRDLGVKDMSSLLPGHGGMLDRIDAILFAAPAAYWFLRIAL